MSPERQVALWTFSYTEARSFVQLQDTQTTGLGELTYYL